MYHIKLFSAAALSGVLHDRGTCLYFHQFESYSSVLILDVVLFLMNPLSLGQEIGEGLVAAERFSDFDAGQALLELRERLKVVLLEVDSLDKAAAHYSIIRRLVSL